MTLTPCFFAGRDRQSPALPLSHSPLGQRAVWFPCTMILWEGGGGVAKPRELQYLHQVRLSGTHHLLGAPGSPLPLTAAFPPLHLPQVTRSRGGVTGRSVGTLRGQVETTAPIVPRARQCLPLCVCANGNRPPMARCQRSSSVHAPGALAVIGFADARCPIPARLGCAASCCACAWPLQHACLGSPKSQCEALPPALPSF